MRRRATRRVQKKYDPSESFSSRDIRLAIQLSLDKNVDTQPQNESKLPESEEPSESKIKDIMTGKRTRKKNPVRHKATLDNQTISGETDKPARVLVTQGAAPSTAPCTRRSLAAAAPSLQHGARRQQRGQHARPTEVL